MAASSCCILGANVASLSSARGKLRTRTLLVRPISSPAKVSILQGIFVQRIRRYEAQRRSQGQQTLAGQAVAEVNFVSGEQAKKLVEEEGYTIIDIRDQVQYERTHIPSAVHIPYFITNDDNDIGTIINRQLHNGFSGLFYGLAFTKANPEFTSTVTKQFPKDSKLLLVCHEGLRSGYASDKLEEAGYQNLAYITSGLQSVEPGTFPKEGKVELKDGGKGGLVTVQGPFSVVLGGLLILAYLFLQFFPEQAEQLFFKT